MLQCPGCVQEFDEEELDELLWVCSNCGYHLGITPQKRFTAFFDHSEWEQLFEEIKTADPLQFDDRGVPYPERISRSRKSTNATEAASVGRGTIQGREIIALALNFAFMGGSMGAVVGERVARAFEYATEHTLPVIAFTCSGGARMQEGILSLMQMAKSASAVQRFHQTGLPYIVVLTHPTMGGVMASFASLGDIIIAEPQALIGFNGPRVIEQTLGKQLPPGFQRSEFLLEHGFADRVVKRPELSATISRFLNFLYPLAS